MLENQIYPTNKTHSRQSLRGRSIKRLNGEIEQQEHPINSTPKRSARRISGKDTMATFESSLSKDVIERDTSPSAFKHFLRSYKGKFL